MTDLSIVIPCYNEGKKLRNNLYKLIKFLNNKNFTYEIIVVNDGSKDNTKKELSSFKPSKLNPKNLKKYSVISYNKNKGKGYAIKKGIFNSKGTYVLFMDSDFSTSIIEILKFWKRRNEADILIGDRNQKDSKIENKSFLRKIFSSIFNIITKFIIPINYNDTQCGFKFFKTDIAKKIIEKQTINRFAFDIEYLYIAELNNYSIKEIPVKWKDDKDSQVKLLSASINMFKDLLKIRNNKNKYIRK